MINLISKSYYDRLATGPKKVVGNLIKGLDKLGYPYVINRSLDSCQRLWIHDDLAALSKLNGLDPKIKVVVGPNLVVRPRQLPLGVDLSRAVYIHPSKWTVEFWTDFGFTDCPIVAWPTGIDTQEFAPSNEKKTFVLVYFKQRSKAELELVEAALRAKDINYQILKYGTYNERDYKSVLSEARYIVWLGRQESQGIALEEAMAMGVPLLVCDVSSVGHWEASAREEKVFTAAENAYAKATSVPYFDSSCGIKIKDLGQLGNALGEMETHLGSFRPRQYVLDNLSLEKQAREFVEIYNTFFGLSFQAGLSEQLLHSGVWRSQNWYNKTKSNLKAVVKTIIRRTRS